MLTGSSGLNLNLRGEAVNVFFILSGFWVTFSCLRSASVKEYALKRFKKIFPLYWAVVIGFALLLVFESSISAGEYFTDSGFWKYLLANISTLNFIHPSLPGVFNGAPVNGSLWTIKVEVGFYILLPFILWFFFKSQKMTGGGYGYMVLLAVFLLSLLYSALCDVACKRYGISESIKNQLPAFLTYFTCGMSFCLYWERLEKILNYLAIPALVIFVLLKVFTIPYVPLVLNPVCLSVLVMWFGTRLTFLGRSFKKDFSYPLYLVHYPLVMLFVQQGFFNSCWGGWLLRA